MKTPVATRHRAHSLIMITLTLVLVAAVVRLARAQDGAAEQLILKKLPWRSIGPAIMGGRIDDFAVVDGNTSIIYAGVATGGVWKTTNNGVTWEPLFDEQGSTSIGDIAIAPSDPNIVWVGTGEPNNRQSSSWGDGIYRSLDGGKTWQNMGLKDSKHIGRVVIDPHDPNIVYVAAVGHLWGPNQERGVYKTIDGGHTWTRSLFIDEDTGVSDLAIDPQSPRTLYASAYQRRRTPSGFNGGGPHSGLYKTIDGGASWTRLTSGLPEGVTGRIGIDIYRSNPSIVYTVIENEKGGIFRSEDRGLTWKKMSDTNHRPAYYSQIRVDPTNDKRIRLCGAHMLVSEDGGRTFKTDVITKIHGDYHALWIDPANSNHMIAGSDGGIHFSYDRGKSWQYVNTIPLGQFYEISVDNQKPYWIYGGLQDNGSWAGPSGTLRVEGPTNDQWYRIGGGDGFYAQVDLQDPAVIYAESQGGNAHRLETRTFESRSIKPEPPPGEKEYRFDWNTPILISPHNHNTLYFAGNRVFKSTDRGDSWTRSDELSKNQDRDKMPIMGAAPDQHMLSRHDGQETFGQIVTITESPLKEGLLYAGTDDGNLHISRDGGTTWKNIIGNVPGVPAGTYVSRVVASRFVEGTAYLTLDGHRSDDYSTYVFVTSDYGQSWKPLKGNLVAGVTARVIREHPRNQNLLFLGTEFGAFVSFDRGGHCALLGGLPVLRVDDIQVQQRDNDLVVATHGRSIWILDSINAIEQLTPAVRESDFHLFEARPGTLFRLYNSKGNTGHMWFAAANPPYGAVIDYYLKSAPKADVKVTIADKSGQAVRELKGGKEPGLNRLEWDLRMTPPTTPEPGEQEGFFGAPRGPRVAPGEYAVKVVVDDKEETRQVRVDEDPRIQISAADRARSSDAPNKAYVMQKQVTAARASVDGLKKQIAALQESLKTMPGAGSLAAPVKALADQVESIERRLVQRQDRSGNAGPQLPGTPIPISTRLNRLAFGFDGYTAVPTAAELESLESISKDLASVIAELNKVIGEAVPALNKQVLDSGVQILNPGKPVSGLR